MSGAPRGVDTPVGPDLEPSVRWLMADLLQWHMREAKPEWWMYFERRDRYQEIDFTIDPETIGGLELVGEIEQVRNSTVWRYSFDPTQDHRISVGDRVLDPAAERLKAQRRPDTSRIPGPGTVWAIDNLVGTIDLLRRTHSAVPHPRSVIPQTPISNKVLEESLHDIARALLAHGTDGPGPARAARRLLGRHRPRLAGTESARREMRNPAVSLIDDAVAVVSALDESYLAIQGPPGTGKTYTAARVILALIAAGRRVAISAFTHSAIRNLVEECIAAAVAEGRTLRIVQKITEEAQAVDHPWVEALTNAVHIEGCVDQADIVAGTAWLFARAGMKNCSDVLIIDEAGQVALANVLAMAPAARDLVLIGDPQQLSQPSKVAHPEGAGLSALEHLLGDASTIAPSEGLLLDETYRMHPSVCEFISEQFYDGRLKAHHTCSGQRLNGADGGDRAGLWFVPVPHVGNRTSSREEADAVAALVAELLGSPWTNRNGSTTLITLDDIVVVTPYNAQVAELARNLPPHTRIGTVDKFQGREAAVAIISMACSTASDAPRGMEFLFSRNRLNVAVSRAKVAAYVVANPGLVNARCSTIEQMRLVNGLCRYLEVATIRR